MTVSSSRGELSDVNFHLSHKTRPPTPQERDTARLVCAQHALDAVDLAALLTILGLKQ